MERLLDAIADKLKLSRDEVRRRNLIPSDRMPYRTQVSQRDGSAMVYDSGDYPECQARALAASGWNDFPARQRCARREGRYIGIGLSNYVEGTGRGPFESASVRIGPSGKILVTTGATAQGQGIKTMLSQIVGGISALRRPISMSSMATRMPRLWVSARLQAARRSRPAMLPTRRPFSLLRKQSAPVQRC